MLEKELSTFTQEGSSSESDQEEEDEGDEEESSDQEDDSGKLSFFIYDAGNDSENNNSNMELERISKKRKIEDKLFPSKYKAVKQLPFKRRRM